VGKPLNPTELTRIATLANVAWGRFAQVFVAALMVGKSRLLGMDGAVRLHPFADVKEANFLGKIKYRPCAKAVYTPSDWDPALAVRSLQAPEHSLALEFVYGYEGCASLLHPRLVGLGFGEPPPRK
jgi:hypothetical protein